MHAIPFDEVVGVEAHGAGRVLVGRGGCVIPVLPDLFSKITPLVRQFDESIPGGPRYPEDRATRRTALPGVGLLDRR
ncbi:hypothetical protein [Streptomyces sp. NPDC058661]|uniref:hypothetical protein n=1 Tax=Streptomyces sp. NPDC058661 TaxID=3346582 RepID=UPI0036545AC6